MIEITQTNPQTKKVLIAHNSKIGDIMKVIEGPYKNEILLHTYDRIISLTNTNETWNKNCSLEVEIFPKGTEFTIKVI